MNVTILNSASTGFKIVEYDNFIDQRLDTKCIQVREIRGSLWWWTIFQGFVASREIHKNPIVVE
jgi:hypothetical protein